MKTLYESILDDQETVINNANIRFENQAKLNSILDRLHEDTLKLIKIAPEELMIETSSDIFYRGFECYTYSKRRINHVIEKLYKLFADTCDKINKNLNGELWATKRAGVVSMFYITEQGDRIMIYKYCQSLHGIKHRETIFKKIF